MKRQLIMIMLTASITSVASAQQPYYDGNQYINNDQFNNGQFAATDMVSGTQSPDGGQFLGAASIGSSEPLYYYNDQERWKHGYIKMMPYYHGFHSFRPYNYHHVFGQSTTAQGFGMSPVMPYSQQFWHKYEHMADLSQGNHEPVYPGTEPTEENSHYPKPINKADAPGIPSAYAPMQQPMQQGYGMTPMPQRENYSQIFGQSQQIAPSQYQPVQYQPVQHQNAAPQMRGPALPAPRRPY